jgi:glutaminyl-tRNA synthetase
MATAMEAVSKAERHLQTALFGLEDMGRPDRLVSGLHNAVVFGRAVTFALQNMSGHVDGFDEWWETKQSEMKSNPLLVAFKDLRTRIEKVAESDVGTRLFVNFDEEFWKRAVPGPPNATGPQYEAGSSYAWWNVPSPDGTTERYYFSVPDGFHSITSVILTFPDGLRQQPAVELVNKYLDFMSEIVKAARTRFIDKPPWSA